MPGRKQAWPNSAACWSPATPAMGTPRRARSVGHLAVDLAAGAHLRQDLARNPQQREQLVVPIARAEVEQQGARGVGHVGGMHAAAGELPEQPGVDRAEGQFAALRPPPRAGHVVEEPREFRARKIGIEHAGRSGGETAARGPRALSRAQASAVRRSCQTMARARGRPVRRSQSSVVSRWLATPRAAMSAPVRLASASGGKRHPAGALPQVGRVVFHPAGPGIKLRKLLLDNRAGPAAPVEDHGAGRRRALVEGEHEARAWPKSGARRGAGKPGVHGKPAAPPERHLSNW